MEENLLASSIVTFRPYLLTEDKCTIQEHERSIYGCLDEASRDALEISLQRAFCGPRRVLTDEEASLPCSQFKTSELLDRMNYHMGTTYDLNPARESLLTMCMRLGDLARDFGVLYSLLRPVWNADPSIAEMDISKRRDEEARARKGLVQGNYLVEMFVKPRRMWDLWSNRVIPTWMIDLTSRATYLYIMSSSTNAPHGLHAVGDRDTAKALRWSGQNGQMNSEFFAVSHAWKEPSQRQKIDTPINGHEWPVPIPTSTSLERIRTELLHFTSDYRPYAWIDALCLRQEGDRAKEALRQEEWQSDIPIIGATYIASNDVVYYLSGLGMPFKADDLASERHWLNRAWTLQESKLEHASYIAGISTNSPRMPHISDSSAFQHDYNVLKLCHRFGKASHTLIHLPAAMKAMRSRFATTDLDKVAGLNYLSQGFPLSGGPPKLPIYKLGSDPEDAWRIWMAAQVPENKSHFLFNIPEPGPGASHERNHYMWCPSWKQAMESSLLGSYVAGHPRVDYDEQRQEFSIDCERVVARLSGFDKPIGLGSLTPGKVTIETTSKLDTATEWTACEAYILHQHAIPDGLYTLLLGKSDVGEEPHNIIHCVAGRLTPAGVFEKFSILELMAPKIVWPMVLKQQGRVQLA